MQGLMQDWPLRLHRIIDHAALQHGSREIVSREPDGSVSRTTYAGLRERARRIAAQLRRDGIGPGDRVGTFCWNSADHMAVWYAAAGIGAVYHTINPRLFPEQIAWIIAHAKDRIIVADALCLPVLERLAAELPDLERVVVLRSGDETPSTGFRECRRIEDWLGPADDAFAWMPVEETDAAGLCYTSGTTADPKGVLYSHRSTVLHAMLIAAVDVMGLSARDVVMPVVPMFHVNAWGVPFAAPMVGAKLVMPGAQLDPASLCDLIEGEGVTMSAGVPTIWAGLLDYMRRSGRRLPGLKRLLVGGSTCPRVLIDAFDTEFGIEVRHAWGMTETSPVASAGVLKPPLCDDASDHAKRVRAKQGYAPFGVEMRIVDDGGEALPWDGATFGRLMVRGFAVTRAYYGDDAPMLCPQGFFDTGDIATIDPDGVMEIVDRSKDVIKSGGEWISSIAIETLAVAHPGVLQAAVIGVAHAKWGERPLLVVVGRDGSPPPRDAILAFLAERMPRWALPDDVKVVDALPLTATGKISKRLLRAQLSAYVFPAAAASSDGDPRSPAR